VAPCRLRVDLVSNCRRGWRLHIERNVKLMNCSSAQHNLFQASFSSSFLHPVTVQAAHNPLNCT
jgi:hypothetical protein